MLAHVYGKKPINWEERVFIQPKLDGVRCLFTNKGAFSRTNKQWLNIQHIEESLKPFFKEYPNIILDGELYNHDLKDDFEKLISLVRKQKPTEEHREEAKGIIQFHCYDLIDESSEPQNYTDRCMFISDHFCNMEYVKPVTAGLVTEKNLKKITKQYLRQGYEGSMLRLDLPYEFKRSYTLQKIKDFSDSEAMIIGFTEGKGKRKGTIGKFIMRDAEGIEFGCSPGKGYTHEFITKMFENAESYLGLTATFTYFGRTKANSYRHPLLKAIRDYE